MDVYLDEPGFRRKQPRPAQRQPRIETFAEDQYDVGLREGARGSRRARQPG